MYYCHFSPDNSSSCLHELPFSEQPMLSGSSQLTFFLLSQHFSLWAWWLKLYLREWKKNLIKIEYLKHSSFSWKVSNTSFHILAMKKKDVSNIIVLIAFSPYFAFHVSRDIYMSHILCGALSNKCHFAPHVTLCSQTMTMFYYINKGAFLTKCMQIAELCSEQWMCCCGSKVSSHNHVMDICFNTFTT